MASLSLSLLLSFARVESKRETRDDRKRKNKTKSLAEIQIMSRRSSALEEDDKTPRQRLFFREKTEGEREFARESSQEREREREREKEKKRKREKETEKESETETETNRHTDRYSVRVNSTVAMDLIDRCLSASPR